MKKTSGHSLPFYRNPRFRYGSLSTALICLGLAALVALNLAVDSLEKKHGWRADFSFNAITTQSQATLDVLDGLTHAVHIYALYDKGYEDAPLLELLSRYSARSPLVTWEQTSLSLNPGLVQQYTNAATGDTPVSGSLIVTCQDTGRWKILPWSDFIIQSFDEASGSYQYSGLAYESRITSAIDYVTRERIPRALFLQGHGELDDEETVYLADLLYANNYSVHYFTLDTNQITLAPDDLLVMLSPQRDLTGDELDTIQAFIRQGGSILFTCDYADPVDNMPNFRALLRYYGFQPKEGIVVASPEESATFYSGNRLYLRPRMQLTDITMELVADNATSMILTGSRAFAVPEETDRDLSCEPLLLSGQSAYLRTFDSGNLTIDQQPTDETGPFALALQASRITEEGSVSRACILGCSAALTSAELYAMTVSQELTIRMTEYLLGMEPVDLRIMSKAALRPMLGADAAGPGSLALVMLPVAVVMLAVLILLPRRRR